MRLQNLGIPPRSSAISFDAKQNITRCHPKESTIQHAVRSPTPRLSARRLAQFAKLTI